MFMKRRKPEAALPWSGWDVSNSKRVMGWERPLHVMAKAAAFLHMEMHLDYDSERFSIDVSDSRRKRFRSGERPGTRAGEGHQEYS